MRSFGLALSLFVMGAIAWALIACGSFSGDATSGGSDAGSESGAALFSVGGTITGLEGTKATLLNGADSVVVSADGTFTFPTELPNGAGYSVSIPTPPANHVCAVTNATGHIANANVSNITVSCPSSDATLSSLNVSAGTLSPAFLPATLTYSADVQFSFLSGTTPSTIVTATTTDPGATITIDGVTVKSGSPSAAIAALSGQKISVVVTAANGVAKKTYALTLKTLSPLVYVKASNTQVGGLFGNGVALSKDGSTMVVGSPGESSVATGINGDQTDMSAGAAGAAYVFVQKSGVWTQQAYLKASNTSSNSLFGDSVAISADGNTIAVGSPYEASSVTGINTPTNGTSDPFSGAVYVFTRTGTTWTQQAYVKASNTVTDAYFGISVALSADGNTLAVGSDMEPSNGVGINGPGQSNTSDTSAGAVYVFARTNITWTQQAYVKASNTDAGALFGASVVLSGDGNTMAVGATGESSNAKDVGGIQTNKSDVGAGAVYVFARTNVTWTQQAYVKASNTSAGAAFGASVALSGNDGNTLAVGATGESSNATGIGGNQNNTSDDGAGAVYVYARAGTTWTDQAYVKAPNTRASAAFGASVTLAGDGNTMAIGATAETSNAIGIDGNQKDTSLTNAGAVYVLSRSGTAWTQGAYVKASNTSTSAYFGSSIALSSDGTGLAIGADQESSKAKGINGLQSDVSAAAAGAVYVFR